MESFYRFALLVIIVKKYYLNFFREEFADLEKKFEPSLINSVVYILSMSMQVNTFAVNYRVR